MSGGPELRLNPERIRTDNGHPFASTAIAGLSQLSVWFVRLGIAPEFIEPASPGQNGKHENMHGHLKRRTARRPRASFSAQQRAFDAFRAEYNDIRPHESLDGSRVTPSPQRIDDCRDNVLVVSLALVCTLIATVDVIVFAPIDPVTA